MASGESFLRPEYLEAMTEEVRRAAPLYQPSRYWEELGQKNREMLFDHGLENFKRTVAQNYFNWLIMDWQNNQFRNLRRYWLRHPSVAPLFNRIEPVGFIRTMDSLELRITPTHVQRYKLFVGILWELVRRNDRTGLSKSLAEPLIGNPIKIWRGKQLISQDLANSLRELNSILEFDRKLPNAIIGELGAGYGRLGYVLLQNPSTRYLVFDVPPTLAVSQWYLPQVFPNARIFRFRHFESFDEIEQELSRSQIAFFTPNQMELLPDGYIDIFASISTLPEMNHAQVSNYLQLIAKKTNSLVYLKQWREWKNELDGFTFSRSSVQFDHFKKVMDRADQVQDEFFEAVWVR
jgi:putative sugar O-methyltransferase